MATLIDALAQYIEVLSLSAQETTRAEDQAILLWLQKSLPAYTQAVCLKQKNLSATKGALTVGVIYLAMRVRLQRQHLIGLPQWSSHHMLPNMGSTGARL
jgi:hypothetical protein